MVHCCNVTNNHSVCLDLSNKVRDVLSYYEGLVSGPVRVYFNIYRAPLKESCEAGYIFLMQAIQLSNMSELNWLYQ